MYLDLFLNKTYSLRYKLFIKYKMEVYFKYSNYWGYFLIKKACYFIKKIVLNRGVILFYKFINLSIYDFKNKSILNLKNNKLNSINYLLREKEMLPDLFIFINFKFINMDFIKNIIYFKIPYISFLDKNYYYNIPYPIILDYFSVNLIYFFFYKSILKGFLEEKIQRLDGKKKKI